MKLQHNSIYLNGLVRLIDFYAFFWKNNNTNIYYFNNKNKYFMKIPIWFIWFIHVLNLCSKCALLWKILIFTSTFFSVYEYEWRYLCVRMVLRESMFIFVCPYVRLSDCSLTFRIPSNLKGCDGLVSALSLVSIWIFHTVSILVFLFASIIRNFVQLPMSCCRGRWVKCVER